MTRKKVESLANKLGATLHQPRHYIPGIKEVLCDAPKGYQFSEGSCTQFVSQYETDGGESVSDAYEDIYQRLQYGVELIPEKSKYLYE